MRLQSIESRLADQLEVLPFVLGSASEETLARRPSSGKWSAREHLAHLARHHEVMLARLNRILSEERPQLERYSAELDPGWEGWRAVAVPELLKRVGELRATLAAQVTGLSVAEQQRVGIHAKYGPMDITGWIEFFLLHEAHHLYLIMGLRGAA